MSKFVALKCDSFVFQCPIMTTVCSAMQCSSLGSSLTPSTRQPSAQTSLAFKPFGFESKNSFDASLDLTKSRSARFAVKPPVPDNDIWKRPPPDFRLQVYNPKPPPRNSREAMKPWLYGTESRQEKAKKTDEERIFLPSIFKNKCDDEEGNFDLRSNDLMDCFEAKKHFARTGMNPAGLYHNPRPHDYRGVSCSYSKMLYQESLFPC